MHVANNQFLDKLNNVRKKFKAFGRFIARDFSHFITVTPLGGRAQFIWKILSSDLQECSTSFRFFPIIQDEIFR